MTCKELSDILLRTPYKQVFIYEPLPANTDWDAELVFVNEVRDNYTDFSNDKKTKVDGVVIL